MTDLQPSFADITLASSGEFVQRLQASQLLSKEELDVALREAQFGQTDALSTVRLIERLMETHQLTPWQVRMVVENRLEALRVGSYRLLERIGCGGMSEVYLAADERNHRPYAVKILREELCGEGTELQRFLRESRAVFGLIHPHIVRAYEFAADEGRYYLVMEYICGETLHAMVHRHGPLPVALAADFVRQAADALAYVHFRGFTHRDVKPDNFVVDSSQTLKLVDLGLVQSHEAESSLIWDNEERLCGSINYIAPEQIKNFHEVDYRVDLYGLGGLFYYLLTGKPPFPGGTLTQKLQRHLHESPIPVETICPDVPRELVDICHRLLEKNREDRFQSAVEVRDRLAVWLDKNAREPLPQLVVPPQLFHNRSLASAAGWQPNPGAGMPRGAAHSHFHPDLPIDEAREVGDDTSISRVPETPSNGDTVAFHAKDDESTPLSFTLPKGDHGSPSRTTSHRTHPTDGAGETQRRAYLNGDVWSPLDARERSRDRYEM